MKRLICLMSVFAIVTLLDAAEPNKCPTPQPPPPQFDKFKKLAGKWEAVHKNMMSGKPEKVIVTYRLTAGNTALIETLFPGTPHEMVSIYHGDGDDLVMTHYCMLGNQPTMRCEDGPNAGSMTFEFDGGTGIKSHKDPHMHSLKVTFVDDNHFTQEWEYRQDGESKRDEPLRFTRIK